MEYPLWPPCPCLEFVRRGRGRYGCVGKSALSSRGLPGFSWVETRKQRNQSPLRKLVLWTAELSYGKHEVWCLSQWQCAVVSQVCVRAAIPQERPMLWQHGWWWCGCSLSVRVAGGATLTARKPGQEGLLVPASGSLRAGKLHCGIKMFAILHYFLPSPVCSVFQ